MCVSVSPACEWELQAPSTSEARPRPCASLWHGARECGSSLVGGGTLLKFRLKGVGMGWVKLLLGFAFLLLWCRWVKWGSTEPAPAGFPRKIDPKTAHMGFSPCLACAASCQHGGGSPGGFAASARERVGAGSRLLWILPGAGIWLGNK